MREVLGMREVRVRQVRQVREVREVRREVRGVQVRLHLVVPHRQYLSHPPHPSHLHLSHP